MRKLNLARQIRAIVLSEIPEWEVKEIPFYPIGNRNLLKNLKENNFKKKKSKHDSLRLFKLDLAN